MDQDPNQGCKPPIALPLTNTSKITMNRVPFAVAAFATRGVATRAAVQHTYFVPRNTRGSVPVYTDIRNNGTRYLVEIRNVTGDTSVRLYY